MPHLRRHHLDRPGRVGRADPRPFTGRKRHHSRQLPVVIEMAGPVLAERRAGGTPWHAHHIAERHSRFAIIALGEGVVGTVAALSAVVDRQGWTLDAVLTGIAGMGLIFGMWWVYFLVPSGEILQRHRDRAPVWG